MVKVRKQRFDAKKKKVKNAKINNLQARLKGSKFINFNESNKLLMKQKIVELSMKKH